MFNVSELSDSTQKLVEEAEQLGIECQIIQPPYLVRMTKGETSWFCMASRTSAQSSVGKEIADNKLLAKQLLIYHDIPTAPYVYIDGRKAAHKIEKLEPPFVLKPNRGMFGDDVHTNLETQKEIMNIVNPSPTDNWLVEEHLEGTEYRIFCVDYKFIAAALRIPAFVIGDGVSTIESLINSKNQQPFRGDPLTHMYATIKVDQDTQACLERQSIGLETVVEEGKKVVLKSVCNMSQGGESLDVTETVCDKNIILFEKISRITNLNIIGIDIMATNLSDPIETQENAGVIEVNASPAICIHQDKSKTDSINVSRPILEMTMKHFGVE